MLGAEFNLYMSMHAVGKRTMSTKIMAVYAMVVAVPPHLKILNNVQYPERPKDEVLCCYHR